MIESNIADRAIQFIGFTADREHIWTVPDSSGHSGHVCLGQLSAKTYGLLWRSYEMCVSWKFVRYYS